MTRHLWADGYCRFPQRAFRRIFKPLSRPVQAGASIVTAYTDGVVTLRSNRRLDGYHEATDLSGFQGVKAGDFVVHGLDILRGSVGISDSSGAISSVCTVCLPYREAESRYFAYAMRAQAFSDFPRAMARGVREGGADFRRWDTLGDLPLPEPPITRQRGIADFLDGETARIGALIAKKRRLDELVRLRLLALIGTATAEGKPTQVRRVISLRTSGPRGWAGRVVPSGVPFVRSANLQVDSLNIKWDNMAFVDDTGSAEAERSRVRVGDVLVGITGANTGWVGYATQRHDGGYVSQHVGLLRPRGLDSKWLAYSIFSPAAREQLLGGQYGGTKQQLSLDELAELVVHVPPQERQVELVSLLDRHVANADKLRAKLRAQVVLLAEHRQALITAAVTGQLKVPGVAA